jgi:hypothetical protein
MAPSKERDAQDHTQQLTRPPFVRGSWAALAYVEGKYNPPSLKQGRDASIDFLGMYVSTEDPGIGLITFTGAGRYRAFHRCGEADVTAEFAAIEAMTNYKIPFNQWQIYPVGAEEAEALQKLKLRDAYEKALKGLARVLYLSRGRIRLGTLKVGAMKLDPRELDTLFLLSPRSNEAILEDDSTEMAIWRSLLGEEAAARRIRTLERLRAREVKPATEENHPNT